MRANGSHMHAIWAIYGNVAPTDSPGGSRIALTASGENCSDFYTITPWGGDARLVTQQLRRSLYGYSTEPSWQPLTGG